MLWPNCSCGDVTFDVAAARCWACGAADATSNTMAAATDAHVETAALLLSIGTSRKKDGELRDGSAVRGAAARAACEAQLWRRARSNSFNTRAATRRRSPTSMANDDRSIEKN